MKLQGLCLVKLQRLRLAKPHGLRLVKPQGLRLVMQQSLVKQQESHLVMLLGMHLQKSTGTCLVPVYALSATTCKCKCTLFQDSTVGKLALDSTQVIKPI